MPESPSKPIPSVLFESEQVGASRAYDAWAERIKGWDIGVLNRADALQFHGMASAWLIGEAVLALGDFPTPTTQVRHARHVRGDQLDHYKLTLLESASFLSDLDGRRVALERPDQVLISDLARPEALTVQGRWIEFYVPRDALDGALSHPMDLHGVLLGGWAASLLGNHLRAILRQVGTLAPAGAPLLAKSAVHLLAAGLTGADQQVSMARPVIQATVLRQICNFIELHLAEPGLSAEQVCGAFQMSRAGLYRMFEPLGGVASFIRERRLERIHALLTNADKKTYLSRVAIDHGFKNTTHFTRVFRERFGYSPSAAMDLGGNVQPVPLRAAPMAMEDFLEGLRSREA